MPNGKREIFFQSVSDETLPLNDVFFISLQKTVNRYTTSGKQVYLFLENPEMGLKPKNCNKRPFTFTHKQPRFQVSYQRYLARMGSYRQQMKEASVLIPGLVLLDPEPLFCDKMTCTGILNGRLMYTDDDHLSIAGSRYVAHFPVAQSDA